MRYPQGQHFQHRLSPEGEPPISPNPILRNTGELPSIKRNRLKPPRGNLGRDLAVGAGYVAAGIFLPKISLDGGSHDGYSSITGDHGDSIGNAPLTLVGHSLSNSFSEASQPVVDAVHTATVNLQDLGGRLNQAGGLLYFRARNAGDDVLAQISSVRASGVFNDTIKLLHPPVRPPDQGPTPAPTTALVYSLDGSQATPDQLTSLRPIQDRTISSFQKLIQEKPPTPDFLKMPGTIQATVIGHFSPSDVQNTARFDIFSAKTDKDNAGTAQVIRIGDISELRYQLKFNDQTQSVYRYDRETNQFDRIGPPRFLTPDILRSLTVIFDAKRNQLEYWLKGQDPNGIEHAVILAVAPLDQQRRVLWEAAKREALKIKRDFATEILTPTPTTGSPVEIKQNTPTPAPTATRVPPTETPTATATEVLIPPFLTWQSPVSLETNGVITWGYPDDPRSILWTDMRNNGAGKVETINDPRIGSALKYTVTEFRTGADPFRIYLSKKGPHIESPVEWRMKWKVIFGKGYLPTDWGQGVSPGSTFSHIEQLDGKYLTIGAVDIYKTRKPTILVTDPDTGKVDWGKYELDMVLKEDNPYEFDFYTNNGHLNSQWKCNTSRYVKQSVSSQEIHLVSNKPGIFSEYYSSCLRFG